LAVSWQPHYLLPHIQASGSVAPCFDLPLSQRTVSNPSLVLSYERCLFPEPSVTYPSGSPVKKHPPGSCNRAPAEKDAPFPEPCFQLPLKVPRKWIPPLPPMDRHPFPEPYSTHPLITHLCLSSPPPCFPTWCLWKEMLCLQSQWFIHSFISVRVPSLGALPRNEGKTYSHHPRRPMRMEGLHTMGCGLVPQRDCL